MQNELLQGREGIGVGGGAPMKRATYGRVCVKGVCGANGGRMGQKYLGCPFE